MLRFILLAGALAMLAAAGATTLALRATTPELAQPRAADQYTARLRNLQEEMALP